MVEVSTSSCCSVGGWEQLTEAGSSRRSPSMAAAVLGLVVVVLVDILEVWNRRVDAGDGVHLRI